MSAVSMNIHALFMHICVSSDATSFPSNSSSFVLCDSHFSAHCSYSAAPAASSSSLCTCTTTYAQYFRFCFSVCFSSLFTIAHELGSKSKKKNRTRGKRCHRCVKNFLFMLTFHLNVSLFVCQFEVLKSRWLKRSKGLTGRGGL